MLCCCLIKWDRIDRDFMFFHFQIHLCWNQKFSHTQHIKNSRFEFCVISYFWNQFCSFIWPCSILSRSSKCKITLDPKQSTHKKLGHFCALVVHVCLTSELVRIDAYFNVFPPSFMSKYLFALVRMMVLGAYWPLFLLLLCENQSSFGIWETW